MSNTMEVEVAKAGKEFGFGASNQLLQIVQDLSESMGILPLTTTTILTTYDRFSSKFVLLYNCYCNKR